MPDIPERDWKVVRKLHPILLQRYCQQVFQDVHTLTEDGECNYHDAYLELYKLVHDRDKTIRYLFNGLSRSKATVMVAAWKHHGLITENELAMFSEETLEEISFIA